MQKQQAVAKRQAPALVKTGKSQQQLQTTNTSTSPSSSSPLAVISRMISTTSSMKSNATFSQQVSFHILHTTLHLFYLAVSIYQYFISHYHRLKLKMLMVTYYHNRTPQLIRQDVAQLNKMPGHIATILQLKENEEGGGMDGLMDQTGDLTAWCIGAGISTLTVYERTSSLKKIPTPELHRAIVRKLTSYYGEGHPSFKINSPGNEVYMNGSAKESCAITINLLSEEDGRETIVDLTRTLAEMAVEDKIRAKDLTIETIDAELKQLLIEEPDLLVLFSSSIDLQGFPPWSIRLSEIFHQQDNDDDVSYTVFYKALQKYAGCKINVGR